MLCYRDKTWCKFYKDCKDGEKCERALTDRIKEDAERWMKNAPICIFSDKPECYKEVKK